MIGKKELVVPWVFHGTTNGVRWPVDPCHVKRSSVCLGLGVDSLDKPKPAVGVVETGYFVLVLVAAVFVVVRRDDIADFDDFPQANVSLRICRHLLVRLVEFSGVLKMLLRYESLAEFLRLAARLRLLHH